MTPPVFSHGSLRLYLLSMLAEEPRHGYELIQDLSARFGGTYSPSAGTIYPRLTKLEEEGLVTKTIEGRKAVYAITAAGQHELADRAPELEDIEDEVTDSVRRLADEVRGNVNAALKTLRADLASSARDAKQHARSGMPTGRMDDITDARLQARFALRDAEFALTEFRQQVRSELRARAQQGTLTQTQANQLQAVLQQAQADIVRELDL